MEEHRCLLYFGWCVNKETAREAPPDRRIYPAVVDSSIVASVAGANAAALGCRVDYTISSHWDGDYTSDAAFGISA